MGPNAHLVAYPISGGRQINVVAIVPGTWNRPGWSAPGEANEIKQAFASARWPATARMLASAVDEWKRWALFTVPEDGEWHEGQIALLGDAAHAMLPFAAQGAGMAIEDARELQRVLSVADGRVIDVPTVLRRYALNRWERVAKVQERSQRNGTVFHASGALRVARNAALRTLGARLLDQPWLYR